MSRQPALLRLLNDERVIGRRRLWAVRLVFGLLAVGAVSGLEPTASAAGLAGQLLGTGLAFLGVLAVTYRLGSRPATETELAGLTAAPVDETRPDTCPSCDLSLPPLVDRCPRCETVLDEPADTASDE